MQQSFLVFSGIITCLVWTAAASIAQEENETPDPIRALIVSGGGSHDFPTQLEILKAGIQERTKPQIKWTVYLDESGRSDVEIPSLKNETWATPFDIVIHHHCFTRVVDPGYIDQILKPHREGVPAVIIHSSLFSFPTNDPRWEAFCGMKAVSHFPEAKVSVGLVEPRHAITAGLSGWESPEEELYVLERIDPEVEVLAASGIVGDAEPQPSMWTHQFGAADARVFATSLGNDAAGLRVPAYLDAVSRGFLWALGRSPEADHREIDPADSLSQLSIESEAQPFRYPGRSLISGGTADAMSEDLANGSPARNAIDGQWDSFWRSGSPGPSVWEVTLNKPVEISALAIEWHEFQPGSYHIEGSLDLLEWSTLAQGGAEELKTGRSLYHFPASAVRAVRISFPMTRPGEHPGIREVSAYAERNQIPAALVYEAGLSDGLRATTPGGLSSLMRIHPDWSVYSGVHLLPPGLDPVEFIECADQSSFLLAETDKGSRTVFRLSEPGAAVAESERFVTGLATESSIAWDGEWLYVLENLQLTKLRDTSGDGVADERHRLGTILNPEKGKLRIRDMELAIDGWIYAIFESSEEVMGTDLTGRPVTLPANGIVRFLRNGSAFQLFVSSLQPVLALRSPGHLSFAVVTESEEGGPVSKFLQYGVFPGRPLESFPRLSPEHIQLHSKGDFVYATGLERAPLLVGQFEDLRSVFHGYGDFVAVIAEKTGTTVFHFGPKGSETNREGAVVLDSLNGLELFPLLSSPSHLVRKEAVFEILRRKRDWRNEAETLLQERKSSSYLPSLALLSQMKGEKTFELLVDAARLSHQAGAYRLLGDRKEAENHRVLGEITKATDPDVTTEILAAIARSGSTIEGLDDLVLGFASVDDSELSGTATEWLIQRDATAVCFEAIDEGEDAGKRRAALLVLSKIPKATVAEGLVLRLEQTGDHEFRREGLAALCDLYFAKGLPWKGTPLIDSFLRASLTDRRVDPAWLLDEMLLSEIPIRDLEELAIAAKKQMPLQAATVALMLKEGTVPEPANSWVDAIISEPSHDPNLRAGALALTVQKMDFKTAFRKTGELLGEALVQPSKEALLSSWKGRTDLQQNEDSFRRYLTAPAPGQSRLARLSLEVIGVPEVDPVTTVGSEPDEYEPGFDVFHRQQCHQCHNIHGEGSSVGPDLVALIARSNDGAFEAAVRNPDAKIAKTYRPEIIELNNGIRLKGLVKSEGGNAIGIADRAGNIVTVSADEVQSRRMAEGSLMPAYSEALISRTEMNALIRFLRKLARPSVAE